MTINLSVSKAPKLKIDTPLEQWLGAEKRSAWTFLQLYSINETHEYTHGIHPYPAKMVPQIARELISKLSSRDETVLDPFCGSGTVLVESLIQGRLAIGVEINPLALLISKVATTPIEENRLRKGIERAFERARLDLMEKREDEDANKAVLAKIHNVYHWFKPEVASHLAIIRKVIRTEDDEDIRRMLEVVFSATMYKVSNIRHHDNPYFARILHKDELAEHNPDVLKEFWTRLRKTQEAISIFTATLSSRPNAELFQGDSRNLSSLINQKADLIVTSPPYGEERNTMDYSRFARLALEWLDIPLNNSRLSLGAELKGANILQLPSRTLQNKIADISSRSPQRAKDVLSFLEDYYMCIAEMYKVLRGSGYACIVIGDRTAAKVCVPNGEITAELGESVGFEKVEIIKRKMYLKALLSNVMKYENVVIMRKA